MTKHINGTYYTASAIVPPGSPQLPEPYNGPLAFHPQIDQSHRSNKQSQVLETIPLDRECSFSFLDPHRKQEVQTREEFII